MSIPRKIIYKHFYLEEQEETRWNQQGNRTKWSEKQAGQESDGEKAAFGRSCFRLIPARHEGFRKPFGLVQTQKEYAAEYFHCR